MLFRINLKNSKKNVLLDDVVYDYLSNNTYYQKIKLLENLREHSSGCAVFQKSWRQADGKYKVETIYLHKIIAEKFIERPEDEAVKYVGAKNANKLDCRLKNLEWRTKAEAARKKNTVTKTGYRGVVQQGKRFRAMIAVNRKSIHIGTFDTAEQAAEAYNKKSRELFGDAGKINKIRKNPKPVDATDKTAKSTRGKKATKRRGNDTVPR